MERSAIPGVSNMGIDLLDIVYRLEKAFSIKIDRDDFFPFDVFNDKQGKYVVNGELTTLGLERIPFWSGLPNKVPSPSGRGLG